MLTLTIHVRVGPYITVLRIDSSAGVTRAEPLPLVISSHASRGLTYTSEWPSKSGELLALTCWLL